MHRRAAPEESTLSDLVSHPNLDIPKVSPFVAKFAGFGYAAKGTVYVMVGVLAAAAALGRGGETTDSRGALHALMHQPFGKILLGIVACGLVCYAAWQFVRAVEDPEHEGRDTKAIFKRIGFFGSGMIHLGLVLAAVRILTGNGGANEGGDSKARGWTATLMSYPLGQWLVGIAGLIFVGYGVRQIYRGFTSDLDRRLVLSGLAPAAQEWARRISRLGISARGVVFGIVGVFLILAAMHENPNEARGLGGALQSLQQQSYGDALLATVALGLIAYGVYEFIRARYRRMPT
jgi:hypothetical protein